MYPKHLINGSVELYKDLYHPSALPSIKSAIEPNKGAKNHVFKVQTTPPKPRKNSPAPAVC